MAEQQELTASTEPKTENNEDPVVKLRTEFEQEKQKWDEERRKLQKHATEAQQDASETAKFLKTLLPRVNRLEDSVRTSKSFTEEWEENPEQAIEGRVQEKVSPLSEDTRRMKHKMAMISLRQKYPDFMKYEQRIAELSMQDDISAAWSWTEEGLDKLYKVAKSEDLEKELTKTKEAGEVEKQKSRAFTETSSSGNGDASASPKKRAISPQERRLIKQLGLTEETYLKYHQYGVTNAED